MLLLPIVIWTTCHLPARQKKPKYQGCLLRQEKLDAQKEIVYTRGKIGEALPKETVKVG